MDAIMIQRIPLTKARANLGPVVRRCPLGFYLVASLFVAQPVFGQAYEVHAAAFRGFGSGLVTGGFALGGGVLIRDRIGIEGDYGFIGDNLNGGAPVLSLGGTWRLTPPLAVMPFVSGGYTRLGDLGDLYGGGGVRVGLSPRSAIRVELRGTFPAADYRGCVPNCSSPSDPFVSLRVSVAFGPGS